jgi:hypothetical protein
LPPKHLRADASGQSPEIVYPNTHSLVSFFGKKCEKSFVLEDWEQNSQPAARGDPLRVAKRLWSFPTHALARPFAMHTDATYRVSPRRRWCCFGVQIYFCEKAKFPLDISCCWYIIALVYLKGRGVQIPRYPVTVNG